ncbi:MAG TPA: FAD/NAD(P)-binding protein [Acidimicrobiales bacterium]|nr:FAD/NAD(P)-binding protein [Acidimicrobiales bacterium]
MTPVPYRVVGRRDETGDVTTLSLSPVTDDPMTFLPGQFNMLTAFGLGEAAISVSGAPRRGGPLEHTVRDVGPVTHALCRARIGAVIGVRGPFGTDWRIEGGPTAVESRSTLGSGTAGGPGDAVVVAGGIGLAPLRGAVHELMARREREGGRVFVIVGAREPSQVIYRDDLERWAGAGAEVAVTVDVSAPGWTGHVGLVTSLLGDAGFDPAEATALVCGPEIMMRFTARALIDSGVGSGRIQVSLERNMQCGVAWCGHCQYGPLLLCRDGPVLPYDKVARLMTQRGR